MLQTLRCDEGATPLLDVYNRDGFVVIPDFASRTDVELLRSRARQLLDDLDARTIRSVFSTQNHPQGRDAEFLTSGDKIRFFFEEKAFNDDGSLKQDKSKSVNKIGHALHALDPVFAAFTRSEKVRQLARDLGVEQPLIVQSMYIFKQPRIGGVVSPHQDSTFLYSEPNTTIGFWVALEDCTVTNGCLRMWPGSHTQPLIRRWLLTADGKGTYFHPPRTSDVPDFHEHMSKFVPLEIRAGTMVVLHGHLVHWSDENRSAVSRHAYTFHLVSAQSRYPADNWLQTEQAFTAL